MSHCQKENAEFFHSSTSSKRASTTVEANMCVDIMKSNAQNGVWLKLTNELHNFTDFTD